LSGFFPTSGAITIHLTGGDGRLQGYPRNQRELFITAADPGPIAALLHLRKSNSAAHRRPGTASVRNQLPLCWRSSPMFC